MSRLYEVVEIQEDLPKFLIVGDSEITIQLAKNLLEGESQILVVSAEKPDISHENFYHVAPSNLDKINREIQAVFFEKEPDLTIENFLRRALPSANFYYLNPKTLHANSTMFFAPLIYGPNVLDDSFGFIARQCRNILENQLIELPDNIEDAVAPIYCRDLIEIVEKYMFSSFSSQKIFLTAKAKMSLISFFGALKGRLNFDVNTEYLGERLVLRMPQTETTEAGTTSLEKGIAETAEFLNKNVKLKPTAAWPKTATAPHLQILVEKEVRHEAPRAIPKVEEAERHEDFELTDLFVKRTLHTHLSYLKKIGFKEPRLNLRLPRRPKKLFRNAKGIVNFPTKLFRGLQNVYAKKFSEKNKKTLQFLSRVFIAVGALMLLVALPLIIFQFSFLFSLFCEREALRSLESFDTASSQTYLERGKAAYIFAKQVHSGFVKHYDQLLKNKQTYENLENLFELQGKTIDTLSETTKTMQYLFQASTKILHKESDSPEKELSLAKESIKNLQIDLASTIAFLKRGLPSLPLALKIKQKEYYDGVKKLPELYETTKRASAVFEQLESALGANKKMQYVMILQNNMELRSTGGFIGSFATLTFEKLKLTNVEVHDVYDADGQLKGRVTPPPEILHFLGQPNWFLRDANVAANFPDAAQKIIWFLEKETKTSFDGVVAIDLDVIEDLLAAVGPVYLPDFQETVTAGNLFEKTESRAEKQFFPGSTQKKDFLSAITKELLNKLLNLKEKELLKVFAALGKEIPTRHLQIFFSDGALQLIAEVLGADGKILSKGDENLMIVENNYGANKANFFLKREAFHKINLTPDGFVEHELRIRYDNLAPADIYPAGPYRAYVKLLVPKNSVFKDLKYEGKTPKLSQFLNEYVLQELKGQTEQLLLNGEENDKAFFATFIDVPVGKTKEVTFLWQSGEQNLKIFKEFNFFFQKQAGIEKDDYHLLITYPPGLTPTENVAPSLAAKGKVEYNLDTDMDFEINLKFK